MPVKKKAAIKKAPVKQKVAVKKNPVKKKLVKKKTETIGKHIEIQKEEIVAPVEVIKCDCQPDYKFTFIMLGFLLIFFGLLFLAQRMGIMPLVIGWDNYWIILLFVIGFLIIGRKNKFALLFGLLAAGALVLLVNFLVLLGNNFTDITTVRNIDLQSPPHQTAVVMDNAQTFASSSLKISQPLVGSEISSPFIVEGEALGNWFFEGVFPVTLLDMNGVVLTSTQAMAQGDWMSEGPVRFKAVLDFNTTTAQQVLLTLEKDNPSGLDEMAEKVSLPLRIK